MKIVQFVADGAPGGGTNHVMQLLRGFADDTELVLLTQEDSYLAEEARELPIKVVTGDFQRSRLNRDAIRIVDETLREHKPNMVHCHGGRAAFFRSFSREKTPSIYTVHGFHFARKNLIGRVAGWLGELWSIRHMNQIVFVCENDQQLAQRTKLLPSGKQHRVIYNGIPAPDVVSSGSKRGVGFIGRMVYQKNPGLFLDMLEQLDDVHAVMVGGGELESEVKAQVQARGLSDRIELLGGLDHESSLKVLADLDVLVMTPRWEGLPLLPLEAMFLSVPVVSTAVGGIPEILTHGQNGLLDETESASELASLVRQLLDDPQLKEKIVTNAAIRVREQFGQDAMIREVRRTYEDTMNRHMVSRCSAEQTTTPAFAKPKAN